MVLYRFLIDESKCMNCGACMDLCPSTCVEFTKPDDVTFYGSLFGGREEYSEGGKPWMMEKPHLISQERCTGCQICVRECPTNAIRVEPDPAQPSSLRPRPAMIRREQIPDDGLWHPLSEYTRDFLKRPVRSPWSELSEWKPMIRERGAAQTWRSMEEK